MNNKLIFKALNDDQRENLQALVDPTAKFFEVKYFRVVN